MISSPLYLVLVPHAQESILQLRTNLEPLESIRVDRVDGSHVIRIPEPIIEVARGPRQDLYGLAVKLFGARWGAWTYLGDEVESYQIQGEGGLLLQLTPREKRIVQGLEHKPNQTLDELYDEVRDAGEPMALYASALRFLHENGFLILETPEGRYSVRRK
jgi:hypothetical protein